MTDMTLLHRQVHPRFAINGRVDAVAFNPTVNHLFKLSTDDGDRITAPAAFARYTTVRKLQSAGSLAITPNECQAQVLEVEADGDNNPDLDDEHVSVIFSGLSRKQRETKSKTLCAAAVARDWTHRP